MREAYNHARADQAERVVGWPADNFLPDQRRKACRARPRRVAAHRKVKGNKAVDGNRRVGPACQRRAKLVRIKHDNGMAKRQRRFWRSA